jgi:hypothetical protein
MERINATAAHGPVAKARRCSIAWVSGAIQDGVVCEIKNQRGSVRLRWLGRVKVGTLMPAHYLRGYIATQEMSPEDLAARRHCTWRDVWSEFILGLCNDVAQENDQED